MSVSKSRRIQAPKPLAAANENIHHESNLFFSSFIFKLLWAKTVNTDGNGNFTIKTNAVAIKISDGSTKDFGQIFESTHTFYCIVTINHTSGLPYDFYITMPYDRSIWYKYPSAPTNTFVHNIEYTKTDYEKNNHNYIFQYNLIGPSIVGSGSISVSIQNNKDTIYATINY